MKKTVSLIIFLITLISLIMFIQRGKTSSENSQKFRIVSAGGDLTEIIYALCAQNYLVGTDTTSSYPKEATQTKKVGYRRNLSIEGIISLNPNLIVYNDEAGPPIVIKQLKNTKIELLKLKTPKNLQDIKDNIATIAKKLDREKEAKQLFAKLAKQEKQLQEAIAKRKGKKLKVLCFLSANRLMAGGRKTQADNIIAITGAENAVNFQGYKPLNAEAIIKLNPDFIISSYHRGTKKSARKAFFQNKLFNQVRAVKEKKVIFMNTLLLLGFGPRTTQAAISINQHYNK